MVAQFCFGARHELVALAEQSAHGEPAAERGKRVGACYPTEGHVGGPWLGGYEFHGKERHRLGCAGLVNPDVCHLGQELLGGGEQYAQQLALAHVLRPQALTQCAVGGELCRYVAEARQLYAPHHMVRHATTTHLCGGYAVHVGTQFLFYITNSLFHI